MLSLVCTIIGTAIAILTYQYTIVNKAKEKRKYLLTEFEFIKNLNSELLTQLNDYIIKNRCSNNYFIEKQTFIDCIKMLNDWDKLLSNNETLEVLKKNSRFNTGSDITTDNLIKDVEYWQTSLFTIQAAFNRINK